MDKRSKPAEEDTQPKHWEGSLTQTNLKPNRLSQTQVHVKPY